MYQPSLRLSSDWHPLLGRSPELFLFSTQLYECQGEDWDYLAAYCGQHIFFYTRRALEMIGDTYGYKFYRVYDMFVWVSIESSLSSAIQEASERVFDENMAAAEVSRVGYGTVSTQKDHMYVKDRFIDNLRTQDYVPL